MSTLLNHEPALPREVKTRRPLTGVLSQTSQVALVRDRRMDISRLGRAGGSLAERNPVSVLCCTLARAAEKLTRAAVLLSDASASVPGRASIPPRRDECGPAMSEVQPSSRTDRDDDRAVLRNGDDVGDVRGGTLAFSMRPAGCATMRARSGQRRTDVRSHARAPLRDTRSAPYRRGATPGERTAAPGGRLSPRCSLSVRRDAGRSLALRPGRHLPAAVMVARRGRRHDHPCPHELYRLAWRRSGLVRR
jgi:hypothetical protein